MMPLKRLRLLRITRSILSETFLRVGRFSVKKAMKGKDFIKVGEPTVTRADSTIVVEDKGKVDRLKSLALREMQLRNAYIEMAVLVFDMLVEIVDESDVSVFEHALKAKRERMKIMGELQKELEELGINASEKEFELNFEENRVVIKIAENNEG